MSRRRRTLWHRTWGSLAALLGLAFLLVVASGLAALPEVMTDERLYRQATPCSAPTPAPAENCFYSRSTRVAAVVIREEPKYEEFTLRLREAAGLPDEIDMGSRGPLLEHLAPGDEVTVTLWRDYAVAVAHDGTVQGTADTPEGEAGFITAVVLALIPAATYLLHTGGSALFRARAWAAAGVPVVVVTRAKWAFGAALSALPAVFVADLLEGGPAAEILAWCAMVPLVRWYLNRKSARDRGRHAAPLTAGSTLR
ncbi:hypothetical protein [Streptomyces sp. NPDC008122]|uniref:hypothetical protein n=1 Tax=Streptomyces sp. NPDC008122 TaxID=3364810 RepID=UPI0036E64FBE